MASYCAIIEVYPSYDKDGRVNYNLPFSYGEPGLGLMGYRDINELIEDIRVYLRFHLPYDNKYIIKKCKVCNKLFIAYNKTTHKQHRSQSKYARPNIAITCSKKCSNAFRSLRQKK